MPRRRTAVAAAAAAVLVAPLLSPSAGLAAGLAFDPSNVVVSTAANPVGDAQGLAFSATVPSDPQRSQGEPAVTVDPAGRIYSCGPTGFSGVNDFASVSTDGGDQFHLLGTAPRGQLATAEGGGDCALATSPVKNAAGDYTLAYSGLGPLTNFSTATSDDGGQTLRGAPVSESIPAVDRQWITFLDDRTALLTYNSLTFGGSKIVQRSTDGGLTYGVGFQASPESGRIGQIRSFLPAGKTNRLTESTVYIPYTNRNLVKMAYSTNGGASYKTCTIIDAGTSPDAGFVSADHDDAGNLYFGYAEKKPAAADNLARRDAFVVPVPASALAGCTGTGNAADPVIGGAKIKMNQGNIASTIFPWIAARGLPGRVALAYYGTDQLGNPDSAAYDAAWNVFVSQSLNALDANPSVAMVQATTHPFHYDSICTAGLGCTINGADRSLVDYFTMEQNVATGGLAIVYSAPSKMPDEASGHVPTPAVIHQVSGPSNNGGTVDRGFRKQVVRTSSPDPTGDAIAGYSVLNSAATVLTPAKAAVPALDLVGDLAAPAISVGPQIDPATGTAVTGGGFSVTMKLKDVSTAALNAALTADETNPAGSLVYLFRFVDGYQSAGVSARWTPLTGWSYAYTGYQVQSAACGSTGQECTTYTTEGAPLTGAVDATAGTIRVDVPLNRLVGFHGADAANRPIEAPAVVGDRIYDGTAITLRNPSADPDTQSFMEQVDGAPAFDFVLGADANAAPAPVVPEAPLALMLPLLGLGLAGAVVLRRRRAGVIA